jgi:hypothetical protein
MRLHDRGQGREPANTPLVDCDPLRDGLEDAGFPLNVGGIDGSKADWANWFTLNPGSQQMAFFEILKAEVKIDPKYGPDLTFKLWQNLAAGNYTPIP